jgi:hypothetical protein
MLRGFGGLVVLNTGRFLTTKQTKGHERDLLSSEDLVERLAFDLLHFRRFRLFRGLTSLLCYLQRVKPFGTRE